MNQKNKRRTANSNGCDFDSESDEDSSCYDTSSDEESDDDSDAEFHDESDEPAVVVTTPMWREVTSAFSPRKTIPEYREPVITGCDENSTVIDVFLKLFPKSLFKWIACCTNERLAILSAKKGKEIQPTDEGEITIVIGCLLIMSYNYVPHISMYWSKNKSVRNDTIADSISRNRFMLLHSKLYFNHPEKPNDAEKTYYMEEMLNCLIYTFNKCRSESSYQSIDEFMVKFKGRSCMKQFIMNKPQPRGMKGFCRADASTGYVYNLFIYQGKEEQRLGVEGTLGERVVTSLCSTMREKDVAVVFDRFFTSVHLIKTLDHPCLGTVMHNRKNLPDLNGKLQRGQSKAKCTEDGIICHKWQDVKEVLLLSNCHEDGIGIAKRKQKDGVSKSFDCPESIVFYNRFMAGVDKCDQYSTYYEIDRKSNKWWKRVFYRLLMITVSNSWIIHKTFRDDRESIIQFLMALSEAVLELGKSRAENLRGSGKGRHPKKKLMRDIGHQPLKVGTRRRCANCAQKHLQVRSLYVCSTCEVPLCVDCFASYHGVKI